MQQIQLLVGVQQVVVLTATIVRFKHVQEIVNVKILFIILSFKLKIISYTQRRRDPVGLRDVFQTEAVFVTREYVDIEPFDIAPQPERRPQPFGREVFVFVIVISGQLSGILARLHAGGLEPLFALRETAQAIIRREGQLPEAERADQRGIYLRKVELLPLDIGVHQRRFAVELRITDPGTQIRMRSHELVFASQVESLAPKSRRRTVYGDDLHAVDGLGGDDGSCLFLLPGVSVHLSAQRHFGRGDLSKKARAGAR